MRPSHLSYAFLSAFLLSIFLLYWWQLPAYPLWLWTVLGFFGLFGVFAILHTAARKAAPVLPITLGITLAFLTVSHAIHVPSPATVDEYADGSDVAIKGYVSDLPDRRSAFTLYVIDAQMLKTGTKTVSVDGRVQLMLRAGEARLQYGDEVIASGNLELPDEERADYLATFDIHSLLNKPTVERTGVNLGNPFLKPVYAMRISLEETIERLLPSPHAGLLAGLLVGARGGLPKDLSEAFKITGLTHIIAISGYNITLVITALTTLLFWLPLRWRFVPSVIFITAFTLLTGASASAVRASIMGILTLCALQTGRLKTTRLAVLWTAFAMLLWNPLLLWHDAGFHLSFLALIGLLEISPLLRPHLLRITEKCGLRETLCLTLSAQMMASPWILFLFGQFSVVAPVSNLIIPFFVPFTTVTGAAAVLLGSVIPSAGLLLAWIPWIGLELMITAALFLSKIPFAAFQIEEMSALWIILYYACLLMWIIRKSALRLAPLAQGERQEPLTSDICILSSPCGPTERGVIPRAPAVQTGTHAKLRPSPA